MKCNNGTDLFYQRAKFGGDRMLHAAAMRSLSFCLFVTLFTPLDNSSCMISKFNDT